jgi:hypothetical protein
LGSYGNVWLERNGQLRQASRDGFIVRLGLQQLLVLDLVCHDHDGSLTRLENHQHDETPREGQVRLSQLKDVLFPVEEHPVFVGLKDESGERRLKVPDRKAIVNGVTFKVLGIVGREYRLVTNEQALEWAYECCHSAFPDTTAAEWDVNATDGPATGGYCQIDLVHRTAKLDFGDVRPGKRPDAFGPFIRVTNSYNALRALAFDIGFHRKVCRNGLIAPETIVRFKFPHQRRTLTAGIRFEVARERLATLQAERARMEAWAAMCTPLARVVEASSGIKELPGPANCILRCRSGRADASALTYAATYHSQCGRVDFARGVHRAVVQPVLATSA